MAKLSISLNQRTGKATVYSGTASNIFAKKVKTFNSLAEANKYVFGKK